jgi:hypothetical protein
LSDYSFLSVSSCELEFSFRLICIARAMPIPRALSHCAECPCFQGFIVKVEESMTRLRRSEKSLFRQRVETPSTTGTARKRRRRSFHMLRFCRNPSRLSLLFARDGSGKLTTWCRGPDVILLRAFYDARAFRVFLFCCSILH